MPRVIFPTFVKWLHLNSSQLSSDIEKYDEKDSGYDYYKNYRKFALAYAGNQQDFGHSLSFIQSMNEGHEKTNNELLAHRLNKWLKKRKITPYAPPEFSIYQAPSGSFEVKVQPEFSMEYEDSFWVVHSFYNSRFQLTPNASEAALHLLKRECLQGSFANARPAILDLASGKLIGKKWNDNRAAKHFDLFVKSVSERFDFEKV